MAIGSGVEGLFLTFISKIGNWSVSHPDAIGGVSRRHPLGGETSFGVTTDGEFLLDAVELNGVIHINGESLEVDCINQIPESDCAAVLYTPRFGEQTLTRRSYEVVLKQLELPLTGRYRSHFKIDAVNQRGNTTIPSNGVVLALDYHLAQEWDATFRAGWDRHTRNRAYTHQMAAGF